MFTVLSEWTAFTRGQVLPGLECFVLGFRLVFFFLPLKILMPIISVPTPFHHDFFFSFCTYKIHISFLSEDQCFLQLIQHSIYPI